MLRVENSLAAVLLLVREERGLTPTHKNGPRSWAWFKRVLPDHFETERTRALPPAAASTHDPEEFDEMMATIEFPEGGE